MTTRTVDSVFHLHWKRDGDAWVLLCNRRKFGRCIPDKKYSGMWRIELSRGRLSDMANLSRVRNAIVEAAERELTYERKLHESSDSLGNKGSFSEQIAAG